ncbi:MAG: hypothetical protein GVY06_09750 [Alphaproteobacteria bacterium]|jgi:sporulation protein YlmC with PRC-barrel domain|nr:hypothetical protein [Alphaproteobacteria bacterium]
MTFLKSLLAASLLASAPAAALADDPQSTPTTSSEKQDKSDMADNSDGMDAQEASWGDEDGANVDAVMIYTLGDFNPAYLASAWLGESVYNYQGEEIGDVSDLVITAGTGVEAAVVNVGGLWDVGDTDVAIPIDEFDVTSYAEEEPRLRVAYGEKELLEAAGVETY